VNGLTSFPHTTRGCMWLLRRSNGVSKSGYGPLGLGSIVSYPSHGHHPIQLLSSPSLLSSFLTEEILFLQERVPNPHYINSLLRRPNKIPSPSSSTTYTSTNFITKTHHHHAVLCHRSRPRSRRQRFCGCTRREACSLRHVSCSFFSIYSAHYLTCTDAPQLLITPQPPSSPTTPTATSSTSATIQVLSSSIARRVCILALRPGSVTGLRMRVASRTKREESWGSGSWIDLYWGV